MQTSLTAPAMPATRQRSGVRESPDGFALEMPVEQVRRLATGWLLLALGSLVVGGLLTVLIVLSRVPYIQDAFPFVDWFRTALVVLQHENAY